jgi:hypothetical protein
MGCLMRGEIVDGNYYFGDEEEEEGRVEEWRKEKLENVICHIFSPVLVEKG